MSGKGNTLLSGIVKSNRRKSLDDITSIFNERCPRAVSRKTIQRKLHELGYSRRRHWGLARTRKGVVGGLE